MSEQKNFLGIPVEGYIRSSHRANVQQRPMEEFAPYLQAALTVPELDSIRWRQYTPYFADGDPCEFSVSDVYFKVKLGAEGEDAVAAEDEDEDGGGEYGDGYISASDERITGGRRSRWDYATRNSVEYGEEFEAIAGAAALKEFNDAVRGGAFENAFLDAFGDHATVTVFRDRVEVEEYSHD